MTVEDELVLTAVAPAPSADRLRALAARGPDWDRVAARALEHGLGTLVTRALRRAAVEPDATAAARLATDERAGERWGLALAAETANVLRALEAGGVGALPLKGVALGVTAYGDPAVRRSGDVDVLIRPADAERAARALAARGYADLMPLDAYERGWFARSVRQLPPVARPGGPKVEVHTAVHHPLLALDLDVGGLFARARATDLPTGPVAAMSPEDSLLVVVSHALRGGWNRLEWVACTAWLAAREDLDWPLIQRLAREAGAARMLALGLVLARDALAAELPRPAAALAGDRHARRLAASSSPSRSGRCRARTRGTRTCASARCICARASDRATASATSASHCSPPRSPRPAACACPPSLRWLHVPARWARVGRRGARAAAR